MRLRIVSWEPTPNPNAMKVVVTPESGRAPRSYFSASDVADDPLAKALFEIEGVANLLIHTSFITIGKTEAAGWGAIRRRATEIIEGAS